MKEEKKQILEYITQYSFIYANNRKQHICNLRKFV